MTAVVVFAVGVGGFLVGLGAFALFAATMGFTIFTLAILGSTTGPAFTRVLRVWGRRVQSIAGIALILVGSALVYAGINPGVYSDLILK